MAFTVFVREATDVGQTRKQNQDFQGYFCPPDPTTKRSKGELYVVADGMGGAAAGDLAAQWAVEKIIYEYYNDTSEDPAASLRRAIEEANYGIYANATADPTREGMGSTVVAAVVWGNLLIVAHVGDSRAYLIRNGQIQRLTEDHSWVADAVRKGILTPEEAPTHPNRNVLTRSLGAKPSVEVDIRYITLQPGDTVLLCTDGLHGVLSDAEIAEVASQHDLTRIPSTLIARANARGGPDNITVTVLRVYTEEEARQVKFGLSDTQPIQPVRPPEMQRLARAPRRAARLGVLGEVVEFLRTYPVISTVGGALLLSCLLLLGLFVAMRGGDNVGGLTMAPTLRPQASVPPVTPRGTVLPGTMPTREEWGYLAFIDQQGCLAVAQVVKAQGPASYPNASSSEPKQPSPELTGTVSLTRTCGLTRHPSWSPDGRWVIYQASGELDGQGTFHVVQWDQNKLQFGEPVTVTTVRSNNLQGRYPTWGPDNRLAYTGEGGALYTCTLTLKNEKWTCADPIQVTTPQEGEDDRYPAWCDGDIWFTRTSSNKNILSGTDEKAALQHLRDPTTTTTGWNAFPACGPGGVRAWSTGEQQSAFNVAIADGSHLVVCLSTGIEPTWGPEGWIAFVYIPSSEAGEKQWELRFLEAKSCQVIETATFGREPAWWYPKWTNRDGS